MGFLLLKPAIYLPFKLLIHSSTTGRYCGGTVKLKHEDVSFEPVQTKKPHEALVRIRFKQVSAVWRG